MSNFLLRNEKSTRMFAICAVHKHEKNIKLIDNVKSEMKSLG